MGIIQKADAWLMSEVFEPLAWRIEYRYDVCHVDIARGCFFATMCGLASFGFAAGHITTVAVCILCMPIVMVRLSPMWSYLKRRPRSTRNPLRDSWQDRVTTILMQLAILASLGSITVLLGDMRAPVAIAITGVSGLSFIAYQYFLGCERMPPGYTAEEKGLVPSAA